MQDDFIRIRPLIDGDVDTEYSAWYENTDGHLDYFTGSGRVFTPAILRDDIIRGRESGYWFYYVIETLAGVRVGNLKIGPIDLKHSTSDLVCLIGNRDYVGKGIGSRAISLGNRMAFEAHRIRRLHSGMYASNLASIRAYTKAGWFVEATMTGFYLVDGVPMDRVCVACLNPASFPIQSSQNVP
jgi:ribosomal-protein-alanine N-acetyltransferase